MPNRFEEIPSDSGLMIKIDGKKLTCPVCGNGNFHTRETLMSTRKLAFFNVEYFGKLAVNYICDACGYVYWFLRTERAE